MITSPRKPALHHRPTRGAAPTQRGTATPRQRAITTLMLTGGLLVALVGLGWTGLQVKPAPFPAVPGTPAPPATVPLPAGLPAPVERFYRRTYGEQIPVIQTAVISGRGTMRIQSLFNLTFPAQFRWTHEAGSTYRHYIELSVFGVPIMKVNEYYVNGKQRMELPWGVEAGPHLDQAGNLGLWAESLTWLPAILVTDPRVRLEAVDDTTAWLVVPFGATEDRLLVRFDPVTGTVQYMEAMRYREATGPKALWINATWFEDETPWLVSPSQEVVYNVPVDTSLTATGP